MDVGTPASPRLPLSLHTTFTPFCRSRHPARTVPPPAPALLVVGPARQAAPRSQRLLRLSPFLLTARPPSTSLLQRMPSQNEPAPVPAHGDFCHRPCSRDPGDAILVLVWLRCLLHGGTQSPDAPSSHVFNKSASAFLPPVLLLPIRLTAFLLPSPSILSRRSPKPAHKYNGWTFSACIV